MTKIFISYRRIDANWAATSLRYHLTKTFPGTEIFTDIASIEPGADFAEEINKRVDQCEALLAVIGPGWLGVQDNYGKRRLDNPNDFVRLEIARALERGIRIIPLLFDNAPMPPAEALPEPLKPLAGKNAMTIEHTLSDVIFDKLCAFLETHITLPTAPETPATDNPTPTKVEPTRTIQSGITPEDVANLLAQTNIDGRTLISISAPFRDAGRYDLREACLKAAIPLLDSSEGPESSWTLDARHAHAHAILNQGRPAEAETLFADLIPLREEHKGKNHPNTLTTRHEHARAILDQGRAAEAETLFADLIPLREEHEGKHHPNTLTARHVYARAILDQGRAAEAEPLFADLTPLCEEHQGKHHPHTLATRRSAARAALEAGHTETARALLAPLPEDGGDRNPLRKGQTALFRAILADHHGDAPTAERHLAEAEMHLAHLTPEHYARRELAHYRATRTPGQPGGTTLWMAAQ